MMYGYTVYVGYSKRFHYSNEKVAQARYARIAALYPHELVSLVPGWR